MTQSSSQNPMVGLDGESFKKAPEKILEVRDVHVSLGGRPILKGINLDLHRGETVVILGGSGCGKSTLLRTIVGVQHPDHGEVVALGKRFSDLRGDALQYHRTRMGILFQSAALFHSMTVGENIACVLREHTPLNRDEIRIVTRMKLEMVGLRQAEDLFPSQLSGGMKKRVGLARALTLDPEIMLYDEPGAGLDPVTLAGVDRLILTFARVFNIGSLVVTHRVESGLNIADKVIFLHEGRVLAQGTSEEIRQHPNARVQRFLGGSTAGEFPVADLNDDYALSLLGEATSP